MGNKQSHDKTHDTSHQRGHSILASTEELEAWLPDVVELKKPKSNAPPAQRVVEDWEDENVVMKATQINTINNVAEERKTLKRNNSFTGKLANLNIGKPKSPRMKNKEGKKGLVRSVSFSSFEKEEVRFKTEEEDDSDLHSSSSDDASVETSTQHDSTLIRSKISNEQQSPTSVCYQDIAEQRRTS